MLYYLLVVNIAASALFGIDKWCAVRGCRRISERMLLSLVFVGGSVGALAGMWLFRHKTRKALFLLLVPIMCLLHLFICHRWLFG